MICAAREMARVGMLERGVEENVAVGVVEDEPTFVGKSRVLGEELGEFIRSRKAGNVPDIKLNFILGELAPFFFFGGDADSELLLGLTSGWDTLIRFFSPVYYPNTSMHTSLSSFFTHDKSTLSCARRGTLPADEEAAFLISEPVKEWNEQGCLEIFDLDGEEEVRGLSSTALRKFVNQGRWEDVRRLVPPGVAELIEREELYK